MQGSVNAADTTAITNPEHDVARFVECVFEPADIVEVRCLPRPNSNVAPNQGWHVAVTLADRLKWLTSLNASGWNIYVGANPRPEKRASGDKCIRLARTIFADFDNGCTLDEARRRWQMAGLPKPTLVIHSGHGIHAYWRFTEPLTNLLVWTRLQRLLIAAVGSDLAIHNPERIMRLPGTQNIKHEPHVPCQIIEADSQQRYAVTELSSVLERFAVQTNGPNEPELQTSEANVIARARNYINKIPNVPSGGRNDQAFKVAAVCREFGLSQSDSLTLIAEWNSGNAEPLDVKELLGVLKNANRYASKPLACKSESKPVSKKKKAPPIEPHQPFPVDSLPDVVRQFVIEAADAIFCDRSFIVLPVLALLARAIGNRRVIRLKTTWCEPAIIWAAIVGKSGTHKTPAIKTVMRSLEIKQAEAIAKHQEAMLQYEQDFARYDAELAAWKQQQKSRAKKGATQDERDLAPWEPKVPVCQRYIVCDATIEAVADRLADQFDGGPPLHSLSIGRPVPERCFTSPEVP